MTEYGKTKCELLEQKGFDANGFAWWIAMENEVSRTYGFVRKENGAKVQMLTISLLDDVAEMARIYRGIKLQMKDIKTFNTEGGRKDEIVCEYADYDWMFSDLADSANEIRDLNERIHCIEEEEPWDEVKKFFELDCENDTWRIA